MAARFARQGAPFKLVIKALAAARRRYGHATRLAPGESLAVKERRPLTSMAFYLGQVEVRCQSSPPLILRATPDSLRARSETIGGRYPRLRRGFVFARCSLSTVRRSLPSQRRRPRGFAPSSGTANWYNGHRYRLGLGAVAEAKAPLFETFYEG